MKAFGLTLAFVLTFGLQATPAPSVASSVSAKSLLTKIPVRAEYDGLDYRRELFKHWVDSDKDGCDTRSEVLIEESKTRAKLGRSCSITSGSWLSVYDKKRITNSKELDIDHFVPLAEAWRSGAWSWSPKTREAFANDLGYGLSLVAVTASSNRSKADQDPENWLPTATFRCTYIASWIAVKWRWSLSMNPSELASVVKISASCSAIALLVPTPSRAMVQVEVDPTQSPANPQGTFGVDPRFSSCLEAKRNGYTKPYRLGVNPEYDWYTDGDNDGIVCE
jgi:hypothetical protein